MPIPSFMLALALTASPTPTPNTAPLSPAEMSTVCKDAETMVVLRDMARAISLEELADLDKLCRDNLRGRR